jgi:hypothetical protein
MAVMFGDKVLDLARGRILQAVTANEVVRDVVLLGVRGLAVPVRQAILGELRHGCGCGKLLASERIET